MKFLEDDNLTALTSELTDAALGDSRVINGRIEAYTMKRAGTDKKYAHALGERYVAEMELAENQLASLLLPTPTTTTIPPTTRTRRSQSAFAKLEGSVASAFDNYYPPFKQQKIEKRRPRACSIDSSSIHSIIDSTTTLAQQQKKRTCLGDFSEMGTRRLMTDLILTLNASFPDYDFGDVRPSHFSNVPTQEAINSANERLSVLHHQQEGESFLNRLWSSIDEVIQLTDAEVYSFVPPPSLGLDFLTQTLVDNYDGEEKVEENPLWSFNYFFVNKHKKRILFFCCVETMQVRGGNEMMTDDYDDDDEGATITFITKSVSHSEPESNFDLDPSAGVAGGIPVESIDLLE